MLQLFYISFVKLTLEDRRTFHESVRFLNLPYDTSIYLSSYGIFSSSYKCDNLIRVNKCDKLIQVIEL